VAPRAAARRPSLGQALENERVLGFLLLSPTVVLLGLFIAYPFVKGVWISLTNATVGNPGGQEGLGSMLQGYTEQSNVSVVDEFINLIVASTGFSAASRIITTSDQLLNELLNSAR
jgi:ABC-type sugar transport system permease subunit